MPSAPRPTDTRGTRAWLYAFQQGFERTPPQMVHPVTPEQDQIADELIGLLELADLRLLEDGTS